MLRRAAALLSEATLRRWQRSNATKSAKLPERGLFQMTLTIVVHLVAQLQGQ